ncbi:acyl-CoA dehydrogenase family protein [Brevundimonas vesicularis]|uniref:acyl-CoA dehydrogenase family protein n=1 Tax=Brevundimonas vesicularis TaxID=41276 RepID=UPI0038D41717
MQYHFTDEQLQIREVISAFLTDHYDHEARTRIVTSPERWSPEIWRAFAEDLGILGLGLPDAVGGLGGGAIDHMLVMDAFGAALVVEPYLESCVLAAGVLARSESPLASSLLEGIVLGEVRFAFADLEPGARASPSQPQTLARRTEAGWSLSGGKVLVVGVPGATHILVSASMDGAGDIGLFIVEANHPGLKVTSGLTIDGRTSSMIEFEGLALAADFKVGDGEDRAEALDRANAALCAEAVGIMRRLLSDTLAYLEQRKQFGTFLVDFQVLQHRLADMRTEYEHAQALAFFAAGMCEAQVGKRCAAISAAKARVSIALRKLAQEAVQMHGAMGMTDELQIGHLFKRATVIENQFGSVDQHMNRVIRAGGDTTGLAFG